MPKKIVYSSLDELFSMYRNMQNNNPYHSYYKLFSSLFPPLPFKMSTDHNENCHDLLRIFNIDYQKIYTPIDDKKQYKKYKADYQSVYMDYIMLGKKVDSVEKEFIKLFKKLDNSKSNGGEYRTNEADFFEWYRRVREQEKFDVVKQRFDYVYGLLRHIRNLVEEYEKREHDSNSNPVPQIYEYEEVEVRTID